MSIEKLRSALDEGRLTISALDDGSGVVLDTQREQLLEMNSTAIKMLQALAEGAETVTAVAEVVAGRFDAPVERVAEDVRSFFAQVAASLDS